MIEKIGETMIIQTKNLSKTYKLFEKEPGLRGSIKSLFNRKFIYKTALSKFDIEVSEGEFVGLIGPNGAGKTIEESLLISGKDWSPKWLHSLII